MNSCNFAGRLTREPEVRAKANGNKVVNFSIAVNKVYYQNEEKKESVVYVDCEMWGNRADFLATLEKGTFIVVEGEYTQRPWEDKEGNKRVSHQFKINNFTLGGGGASVKKEEKPKPKREPKPKAEEDDEEDLPF